MANECVQENVTVTVRAFIYNDVMHRNQVIYRLGGATLQLADDYSDTAYFGGLRTDLPDTVLVSGFDQIFSGKTRNFIAYIEGTDIGGEMEQKWAGPYFNNPQHFGVVSGMDKNENRIRIVAATDNGYFWYQEVKLKVKKGTKGFIRLSSHHAESVEPDTSTFVIGLVDLRTYTGKTHLDTISNGNEEIYFDTCAGVVNGNLEIFDAFVVQDNAVSGNAVAFNGYLKDAEGRPVEGAMVVPVVSGVEIPAGKTDHNGFYHLHLISPPSVTLHTKVEQSISGPFITIQTDNISGTPSTNVRYDIKLTNTTYNTTFRQEVRLLITDCDNHPVGGIRVALSGSKVRITSPNGYAIWEIRNYETRNRVVTAVTMDHNGCFTLDCGDNCNPCMGAASSPTPPAYHNGVTTLLPIKVNIKSAIANLRGLKAGGLYPMAFLIQSPCGKISAAYELPSLRIPKTQEKGELIFSTFSYDATGIHLPFDGCLKILRGENLNSYELQWIVDKIERTGDGKIKLTIQSLSDYNEKYFFKTNTIYQYLKGDRVEFIRNGDGKIFDTATHGLLNYMILSPFHDTLVSGKTDAVVDYFNQLLIQDDGKLDGLVEGAVIELQREKACQTEPVYYDICVSIPIVDGALVNPAGTFSSFDTFLVSRTLTYKQADGRKAVFPAQIFEHHSPSDFWGDHLNDAGKAYFANKFEMEKRYERSISINAPLRYNYFGDLVKKFDAPEQGGLVAMNIVDGKIILAICEHDVFLAQTADELVRVGGDGIIRAVPGDSIITDAQPKVRGAYGCQYSSIGSVFFGDGYAWWADVDKGHYIFHDYGTAEIAGMIKGETTMNAYTNPKFQELVSWNRSQSNFLNHYRFSVGFNLVTKNLHATIKTLRQPATNNEKAAFRKKNETLVFNPLEDAFLTFHSATPEAYSTMTLFDGFGCAMIQYYNGIPYITPINPKKYNEFFGTPCDWIVSGVLNENPTKTKIALSLEIEGGELWYSPTDGIKTEEPNFTSEIPASQVKKNERKYNANFLNDVNSRGGLWQGSPARSYAVSILLVRDNTDGLKYNTIDSSKQVKYGELDLILIKYAASEQSGFENNL